MAFAVRTLFEKNKNTKKSVYTLNTITRIHKGHVINVDLNNSILSQLEKIQILHKDHFL